MNEIIQALEADVTNGQNNFCMISEPVLLVIKELSKREYEENKQLKTTLNEIREHISKEIKENEDLIEILEGTSSFRIGNAQSKIKILKEILEIIERGNKE